MYQIVASKSEYTEEEVREALSTTHPNWVIESMRNEDGWLVRLKEKTAEFPFEEEDKDDTSSEDKDDAVSDDKKDDSKDDSEDDSKDDKDGDKADANDDGVIDEGEKRDLVGELKQLQDQVADILGQLGEKAKEVADDAQAKDDKIKEIADSVKDVAPADDLVGLDDMPMVGDGAPAAGAGMSPAKPKLPSKKRPEAPGGISTFTKNRVEIVRHPGTDEKGERISILAAAQQLETSEQFADFEIISMTENRDGSFAAKLRRK